MSQHETFIWLVLSDVSVVMLFHYGITELERFKSVTFILLHHCPATCWAGWGRAGLGCEGVSRGVGASIPAMDSKTSAETAKPSVLLCNHHLVDRLKRLQR